MWYNDLMGKEVRKEDAVSSAASDTGAEVLRKLAGAAANTDVEVAGERVNARESHARFKEALGLVKQHLGNVVDVDLNKIEFTKLGGNIVGEAVERATLLDPAIFRHPAFVIAQVVAHELLHKNTRIPNDGLVQAAVERVFGKSTDVQHTYEKMVTDFRELAARFNQHGDSDAGIQEIYRLYDREDFEGIFERYEKNYISRLDSEEERDRAFEFFLSVFPELEYDGEKLGYATVKVLEDKEAASSDSGASNEGAKESEGEAGGEVVDLAAYRKRVADKERGIKDDAA